MFVEKSILVAPDRCREWGEEDWELRSRKEAVPTWSEDGLELWADDGDAASGGSDWLVGSDNVNLASPELGFKSVGSSSKRTLEAVDNLFGVAWLGSPSDAILVRPGPRPSTRIPRVVRLAAREAASAKD